MENFRAGTVSNNDQGPGEDLSDGLVGFRCGSNSKLLLKKLDNERRDTLVSDPNFEY